MKEEMSGKSFLQSHILVKVSYLASNNNYYKKKVFLQLLYNIIIAII